MNLTNTIQAYEVLWVLSPLIGVPTWLSNLKYYFLSWLNARELGAIREGRLGSYFLRLSICATIAELIFLFWGVFAMFQPSAVGGRLTPLGLSITIGLVILGGLVLWVGIDLKLVTRYLLSRAPGDKHGSKE